MDFSETRIVTISTTRLPDKEIDVTLSWKNKKMEEGKAEVRLPMTSNKFKDRSVRTADLDHSDWPGFEIARGPANLIIDVSCPARRQLKGCLKVKSPCESLARIAPRLRPPSSAQPTTDKTTSKVLFDSVEIREYHHMLSNNPTSLGAPISLDGNTTPRTQSDLTSLSMSDVARASAGPGKNLLSRRMWGKTCFVMPVILIVRMCLPYNWRKMWEQNGLLPSSS